MPLTLSSFKISEVRCVIGITILVGLVSFCIGYYIRVIMSRSKINALEREKRNVRKRHQEEKETNAELAKRVGFMSLLLKEEAQYLLPLYFKK